MSVHPVQNRAPSAAASGDDNQGTIESLPRDMLKQVFSHLNLMDQQNTRPVCRVLRDFTPPLKNPSFTIFGKQSWKKYCNFEVEGEIPEIPKNIFEKANTLLTLTENKVLKCSLVLMPKDVNHAFLKTRFKIHPLTKNHLNALSEGEIAKNYWVLMTNTIIRGSRNKTSPYTKSFLASKSNRECVVPSVREVAVCCFMHQAKRGDYLFPGALPNSKKIRTTYTITREIVDGTKPVMAGGNSENGLNVVVCANDVATDGAGVAACIRFH